MMSFQKVPSTENLADILTKDFKDQEFQRRREMIGMHAEEDKQVEILKNLKRQDDEKYMWRKYRIAILSVRK